MLSRWDLREGVFMPIKDISIGFLRTEVGVECNLDNIEKNESYYEKFKEKNFMFMQIIEKEDEYDESCLLMTIADTEELCKDVTIGLKPNGRDIEGFKFNIYTDYEGCLDFEVVGKYNDCIQLDYKYLNNCNKIGRCELYKENNKVVARDICVQIPEESIDRLVQFINNNFCK